MSLKKSNYFMEQYQLPIHKKCYRLEYMQLGSNLCCKKIGMMKLVQYKLGLMIQYKSRVVKYYKLGLMVHCKLGMFM